MPEAIMMIPSRNKLSRHYVDGISVRKATHIIFGDGGHDSNLNVIAPVTYATELVNEILRKEIDYSIFEDAFSCTFFASAGKNEINGFLVSEIGLLDEKGLLIAQKNIAPREKLADKRYEVSIKLRF